MGVIGPAGPPGPQGLPGKTGLVVRRTRRYGTECFSNSCHRVLLGLEVLEEKQDYLVRKYVQWFVTHFSDEAGLWTGLQREGFD